MLKINLHTAFILAIFTIGTVSIDAAWGDRDLSFGTFGISHDSAAQTHTPLDVALQPDRSILVTGYQIYFSGKRIFLRRYLSNGSPDLSFGQNGWGISNNSWNTALHFIGNLEGHRIAVLDSGKIAVLGSSNGQHAVWMYNADGTSDSTFGTNGRAILSVSTSLVGSDIAAVGTRVLLLFGSVNTSSTNGRLLMLDASGSPAARWGLNGSISTGLVGRQRMYVDPITGKIVVGGRISGLQKLRIRRFMSNGTVDGTFTPFELGSSEQGIGEWLNLELGHLLPLPNDDILFTYSGTLESSTSPVVAPPYFKKISASGSGNYGGWMGGANGNFGAIRTDGKFVMSSESEGRFWRINHSTWPDEGEGTPQVIPNSWNFATGAIPAVQLPDDRILVVGRTSVISMMRLRAN